MDIFKLADELRQLREIKREAEQSIKEVNQQIEEKQAELIELMIDLEVPSFKRGEHNFYINSRIFASVKAGKKPKLIEWLKKSPYAEMVREDINTQTLSAWVRELSENGELPEEIANYVNVFEKQSINIRKA